MVINILIFNCFIFHQILNKKVKYKNVIIKIIKICTIEFRNIFYHH